MRLAPQAISDERRATSEFRVTVSRDGDGE
jgi:hypothetical protein